MGVSKLFVSEALILKKDLYDSRSPKLFVDFFIFHMRQKTSLQKKLFFLKKQKTKKKQMGTLLWTICWFLVFFLWEIYGRQNKTDTQKIAIYQKMV